MLVKCILLLLLFCRGLVSEIHDHPGSQEIPHDRYLRVVSEADSPVLQTYIPTKDGLYLAAAIRKPRGEGPFPALVYFHGAPGGRGMEQLVGWSRGATGSPVWERFLQEGYVVVVADYRRRPLDQALGKQPVSAATEVDDGESVVEYVRKLPYVDSAKIAVYGVSLGGHVVLHVIGRTQVRAAVLGAPAAMRFLGVDFAPKNPPSDPFDRYKDAELDRHLARENIRPIECPILILVGTKDRLIHLARPLHDLLEEAGKAVRMDVYENAYHDFCIGPQGHDPARFRQPLLDTTLEALEVTVKFLSESLR